MKLFLFLFIYLNFVLATYFGISCNNKHDTLKEEMGNLEWYLSKGVGGIHSLRLMLLDTCVVLVIMGNIWVWLKGCND